MIFLSSIRTEKKRKERRRSQAGFLLIELIVSLFIFGLVAAVSIGALISALDANKKTQALKSVLNNLTIVLDSMTKSLAVGKYYRCGPAEVPLDVSTYMDCPTNDNSVPHDQMSFLSNDDLGSDGIANDVVSYRFNTDSSGGYIERVLYLDGTSIERAVRMTAPEVNITELSFYVTGSVTGSTVFLVPDTNQPAVLIIVKGYTNSGPRNDPTEFAVQTMVSQRIPDFE